MSTEKIEKKKIKAHVSESKKKIIKEIKDLAKKYNTIMILDIAGMPSSQFQKLRKKLKNEVIMKVIKKKLAIKIFESDEKTKLLLPWLEQSSAVLFSNIDPFELAIKLSEERSPARARPGQIANEDIMIEAGPTNLMAGPALSDLSKGGLKVGVEGGKIAVKERKILVKKGEKISADIANILGMLEIMPFTVGLEPVAAYDTKSGKISTALKINRKEIIDELKDADLRTRGFAVNIVYISKDTISSLIAKVGMQFNKLNSLINIQQNIAQ